MSSQSREDAFQACLEEAMEPGQSSLQITLGVLVLLLGLPPFPLAGQRGRGRTPGVVQDPEEPSTGEGEWGWEAPWVGVTGEDSRATSPGARHATQVQAWARPYHPELVIVA